MPHRQKYGGKSADDEHTGEQPVISNRRRIRSAAPSESVVLSSKYVVERIRDRVESPESDVFWGEYPKSNAEALEKRGIEIDVSLGVRHGRKKIRLVEEWFRPKLKVASKRDAREKVPFLSPRSDSRQRYFLDEKDTCWLTHYNLLAAERKVSRITAEELEGMIGKLETKKNAIILENMKSMISALKSASEGTQRLHSMEHSALQRFMELTPESFSKVSYKQLGQSCSLSPEAVHDIWEYWKCRLQDRFCQPLLFPCPNDLDYRRLSLLAAWNLTNVSYAQRIRHDAERVRLMYDICQKRNMANKKVSVREEELTSSLADLSFSPEMKCDFMDKLTAVVRFMEDHPATGHWEKPALDDALQKFISSVLLPTKSAEPEQPLVHILASSRVPVSAKRAVRDDPGVLPTVPEMAMPEPLPVNKDLLSDSRVVATFHRSPLNLRKTKARVDFPRTVKFDNHSDNSCCENGPLDEDELMRERKGSIRLPARHVFDESLDTSDEPLYLLNDISQKLNFSSYLSKSPDLRSRLRARKRV